MDDITEENQKQNFLKVSVIVTAHRFMEYANELESIKEKVLQTSGIKAIVRKKKLRMGNDGNVENYSKIIITVNGCLLHSLRVEYYDINFD